MLTLGNAMYLGIFPRNNQPRILRKNHHSRAGDFICFPGNNAAHIIEEFGIHLFYLNINVKIVGCALYIQLFCQTTQMDAKFFKNESGYP